MSGSIGVVAASIVLGGSGPVAYTAVWDPVFTNSAIALSLANKRATQNNGTPVWISTRGVNNITGYSAFVTTIATSGVVPIVGVGNTSMNLGNYPGNSVNSVGMNALGDVYQSAGIIANVGFTTASGDVITTEWDHPNTRIRYSKNGGAFSSWITVTSMGGSVACAAGVYEVGSTATLT